MPPDKEMGIWRDVHITATGPVTVRYPAVLTKLNFPSANEAQLTVRAELSNATERPVDGVLKGHIENIAFEQPVHVGPRGTQVIRFTPDKFSQLEAGQSALVVAGAGRQARALSSGFVLGSRRTGLRLGAH